MRTENEKKGILHGTKAENQKKQGHPGWMRPGLARPRAGALELHTERSMAAVLMWKHGRTFTATAGGWRPTYLEHFRST